MRYFKRHKIITILLIILSVYVYINYTSIFSLNENIDRSSEFYINDLYLSDGRIYKNYLNKDEKQAYDDLMKMIIERTTKKNIDIYKYSSQNPAIIGKQLITSHDAILIDHPELLQYSGFSYTYNNKELKVRIEYAINNQIEEEINTLKIKTIINKIKNETKNMSDLDKINYVYNWIGENARYDTLFTYSSKNQSIYNVFIKKNAVCAGFSKTSQVIFQNIGIESMSITGNSTGPHMWNIVKYNDKYYYYDSTYAASIRDKKNNNYYGGLTQTKMNSYTINHPEWYPTIEKDNALAKKEN